MPIEDPIRVGVRKGAANETVKIVWRPNAIDAGCDLPDVRQSAPWRRMLLYAALAEDEERATRPVDPDGSFARVYSQIVAPIEEIEPVADRAKRCADTGVVPWAAGRYLALTSYRRDGDPVVTPVWFVTYEGRLWLWTDAASGKVKRIRNSSSCTVAPCTMSGRITDADLPGQAWLVPADHCEARVQSMLRAKYPIQKPALDIYSRLRRRGAPAPASAYVEIALTAAAGPVPPVVGEGRR